MKTLTLTLKTKWYDMIYAGIKKEEYREIKEHWCKRFLLPGGKFRYYDQVTFINGYNKNARRMTLEFKGFKFSSGRPEWGGGGEKCFALMLGNLIWSNH